MWAIGCRRLKWENLYNDCGGRYKKMTKDQVCARIREIGIIPAIRVASYDDAHFATEAVESGGIPIVEITMTVPQRLS